MVVTVDSFSSDDSTVCVLKEKDIAEKDQVKSRTLLSSVPISTSTNPIMLEIKDLEGNVSRPSKKEEPPKVLHP
jgi:hypothetical protein